MARLAERNPSNESGLPWAQTMTAQNWETIGVPAGRFKALRFTKLINFRSAELGSEASYRWELLSYT